MASVYNQQTNPHYKQ